MIRIELDFPKALTRPTGNPYGREIFNNQVANLINYDEMNIIVFPEHIIRASSSFVQGFFSDIIKHIGYEGLKDHIIIDSKKDTLKESIWKNLL